MERRIYPQGNADDCAMPSAQERLLARRADATFTVLLCHAEVFCHRSFRAGIGGQ
jgi:hypothetical protein